MKKWDASVLVLEIFWLFVWNNIIPLIVHGVRMPWWKIKRGLKKDDSLSDSGLTWITNIFKKIKTTSTFKSSICSSLRCCAYQLLCFFSSQKPKSVTAASSVTLINPGNITLHYRLWRFLLTTCMQPCDHWSVTRTISLPLPSTLYPNWEHLSMI